MIFNTYVVEGATTEVTLCPIGDIQWAGDRRDLAFDMLRRHIDLCLQQVNPLFLGMGDYVDFASPSNRQALRQAPIYDTARRVINDAAAQLADEVYELILKPTKGMWVGLHSGHHLYPLFSGGNTDIRLCEMLDAAYLGPAKAITFIDFKDKTHTQTVTLYSEHGDGYGKKATRPLDMLEALSAHYETVDIFCMGHHTKKGKADGVRMAPIRPKRGSPRLKHRELHYVATGGWTKGYRENTITYVEQRGYSPVQLGAPLIHIRPHWRNSTSLGTSVWEPGIRVEV